MTFSARAMDKTQRPKNNVYLTQDSDGYNWS